MKHPATAPRGFLIVVGAVGLSLAAAGVPSALYPTYRHQYGLSSLAQTALFATYAIALFPALLIGGRLLRRFSGLGIIVGGVALVALADGLFAHDAGLAELFAARAVQGVGIGLINAAAGVLAMTTRSDANPRKAALGTALATAMGLALGVLGSGTWLRLGPRPTLWPYAVHLALSVLIMVAVASRIRPVTPEAAEPSPHKDESSGAESAGRGLVPVCVAVFLAWGYGGLLLAVLPDLVTRLGHAAGGPGPAMLATMFVAVAGSEWVAARFAPARGMRGGLGLLALGGACLVLAAWTESMALLVAATVVLGFGLGATFVSAIASANDLIPAARAHVLLPLFYACVFGGNALPAVMAGALAGQVSLTTAVAIVSAGLAVGAAAVLVCTDRPPNRLR